MIHYSATSLRMGSRLQFAPKASTAAATRTALKLPTNPDPRSYTLNNKSTAENDERRDNIRQQMRSRRAELSTSRQSEASQALSRNILRYLNETASEAKKIAGYRAVGGELSMQDSFERMQEMSLTTYLPIVRDTTLLFAPFDNSTEFVSGKFGIATPDYLESDLVGGDTMDLVFVPLTAFDKLGNRLGMGGGFYDRTFAYRMKQGYDLRQGFIGVAYEFQECQSVPSENWDVPLQAVVTDQSIHSINRKQVR